MMRARLYGETCISCFLQGFISVCTSRKLLYFLFPVANGEVVTYLFLCVLCCVWMYVSSCMFCGLYFVVRSDYMIVRGNANSSLSEYFDSHLIHGNIYNPF
jgi:hypothetical protein